MDVDVFGRSVQQKQQPKNQEEPDIKESIEVVKLQPKDKEKEIEEGRKETKNKEKNPKEVVIEEEEKIKTANKQDKPKEIVIEERNIKTEKKQEKPKEIVIEERKIKTENKQVKPKEIVSEERKLETDSRKQKPKEVVTEGRKIKTENTEQKTEEINEPLKTEIKKERATKVEKETGKEDQKQINEDLLAAIKKEIITKFSEEDEEAVFVYPLTDKKVINSIKYMIQNYVSRDELNAMIRAEKVKQQEYIIKICAQMIRAEINKIKYEYATVKIDIKRLANDLGNLHSKFVSKNDYDKTLKELKEIDYTFSRKLMKLESLIEK